jgi:hypothetical protein
MRRKTHIPVWDPVWDESVSQSFWILICFGHCLTNHVEYYPSFPSAWVDVWCLVETEPEFHAGNQPGALPRVVWYPSS